MKQAAKKVVISIYFILGCLLVYSCASSGSEVSTNNKDSNVTVATGVGSIVDNEMGRAKDDALNDAKKIAVQQVLGAMISGRTDVDSGVFQSSQFTSNTEGFIEKYEILEQGAVSKFEYRLKIKAHVSKAKINSVLEQVIAMKGKPRLMFVFAETFDKEESKQKLGRNELENIFINKGFPVVDQAITKKILEKEKKRATAAYLANDSNLASLGSEAGAEVVIFGTANFTNAGKIMDTNMVSIQATMSARAIDVNTAKLLATAQDNSASAHINPESAAIASGKKVAGKVGDNLINTIAKQWQPNKATTISVFILGLDFEGVKTFRNDLLGIRGVKSVNRKSNTDKTANLEVEFDGNSDIFADRLLEMKSKFKVTISESRNNYLALAVK